MKQPVIFMRGQGFNPFTPLPMCRHLRAPAGTVDEMLRIHSVPLASAIALPPKERFDNGPYEEGDWEDIEPWETFGAGPLPVTVRENEIEDKWIDAPARIVGTSLTAKLFLKVEDTGRYTEILETIIGDGRPFDIIAMPRPKWDDIKFRYGRHCTIQSHEMGRNMLTVVLNIGA